MTAVFDPEVYGEPIYSDVLWDTDVYGEWTAEEGTSASAEVAAGTGAATGAAASVAPSAETTAGTGAAADATVSTGAPAVEAPAEVATASAAALSAAIEVGASSGAATGSGAAYGAGISHAVPAELASGAGVAYGPSVAVGVSVGAPTAVGAAYGAAPSVGVPTGTATGVGEAITAVFTNAPAETASATGAAYGAVVHITTGARPALGLGSAHQAYEEQAQYRPNFVIEGLGDVTGDVLYGEQGASLVIAVGGDVSMSKISIRDLGSVTREFITGKRVTVSLNGVGVIWAGFVTQATRVFWFPVDAPETLQRRWDLDLADINLLFSRRFAFNRDAPARVQGPVYRTVTADTEAISELLADWLDLDDDDLDTTTRVTGVGDVNPAGSACLDGNAFYPFNGSMSWGESMKVIAQLPAAIYALIPGEPVGTWPFGRLLYADVEEVDAPFVLSDNPIPASGQVGYRDCMVWDDGSDLANDSLAWGFGKGQDHGVFDRREDATSISEHGLWQRGDTIFNVWCQDTIEKVTDSIINGSPSSRRGQKDPYRTVELTTYTPGLQVGTKVRFINGQYGIDEVLPVRKLTFAFPTATDLRTEVSLGHMVDRWGFEDPTPPFPDDDTNGGGTDQAPCGGTPLSCWLNPYVLDTFSRYLLGATGETSWQRYAWQDDDPGTPDMSVNGRWQVDVSGLKYSHGADEATSVELPLDPIDLNLNVSVGIELPEPPTDGEVGGTYRVTIDRVGDDSVWVELSVIKREGVFDWSSQLIIHTPGGQSSFPSSSQSENGNLFAAAGLVITVTSTSVAATCSGLSGSRSWSPDLGLDSSLVTCVLEMRAELSNDPSFPADNNALHVWADTLRVTSNLGNCVPVAQIAPTGSTVFDDDFNRTETVGLGDSPPPLVSTWVAGDDDSSGAGDVTVNGSEAHLRNIGDGLPPPTQTNRVERQIDISGPAWRNGEFILTGKMRAVVDPPNHSSNGDYDFGVIVRDSTNDAIAAQAGFYFLMSPRDTSGFNSVRGLITGVFRNEIGGVAASYSAQNIYAEGASGEVFVDGTWAEDPGTDWMFELDLSISRGDIRARVWHASQTRPEYIYEQSPAFYWRTWTVPLVDGWGTGLIPASIHIDTSGASNVAVQMDSYLDWLRLDCQPRTAVATGRHGRVRATRVSETTYQVYSSYDPASVLVWRNGVLQRSGIDFTMTDPSTGIIEFSSSVSVFETITVWFVSAGLIDE